MINIKPSPNSTLEYRPDIDGLRAISIIFVILFHAFPNVIRGGFIGVDVFFVISGFLISGIIYRELKLNRFTFLDFWVRRICRIFPTFLLVTLAVFIFGYFYLLNTEFFVLKTYIKYALLFFINFKLSITNTGYFAQESIYIPLVHYWSLAVEEQFYLIWPFFIFLFFKLRLNMILSSLFLLFLILKIHHYFPIVGQPFYRSDCRFWELQTGALVFFLKEDYNLRSHFSKIIEAVDVLSFRPRLRGNKLRRESIFKNPDIFLNLAQDTVCFIGLAFILLSSLTFYRSDDFPTLHSLLPVIGSAMIILAGPNTILSRKFLSCSPMRFIGSISFPMYLWHYPILSFLHIFHKTLSKNEIIATILITLLLSCLTYFTVEKFFRSGSKINRRRKSLMLILFSSLFFFILSYFKLEAWHNSKEFQKISDGMAWEYPSKSMEPKFIHNLKYYEIKTNILKSVLFLGDSHIEHYAPYVEKLSHEKPNETLSSLWVTNKSILSNGVNCAEWLELDPRDADHGIDTSGCTIFFNDMNISDNIEKIVISQKYDMRLRHDQHDSLDPISEKTRAIFKNNLSTLKSTGKEVIVLLDAPMGKDSFDPKNMIARSIGSFSILPLVRIPIKESIEAESRNVVLSVCNELNIKVIDPLPFVCENGFCSNRDNDFVPLFMDTAQHFSPEASRRYHGYLDQIMLISGK